MRPAVRRCAMWLLISLLHGAQIVSAQHAPAWLPPHHWSGPLVMRAHALGVAVIDPVLAERSTAEVVDVLAERHAHRLRRELALDSSNAFLPLLEAAGSFVVRRGALRPGRFTGDQEWVDPVPIAGRADPAARLRARAHVRRWLAVNAAATALPDAVQVDHATVDAVTRGIAAWAGRRRLGYRPDAGGGLVLTELTRFDGAGVRTSRPLTLPVAGAVTLDAFGGRLDRNGRVASPWLLGMRIHARPHARFDLGVTRVAMFGGMDGADTGLRQWLEVLIGANLSDAHADDQVASLDVRWRPDLRIPLELHGEWGMHDIDPGVLLDVPAFTAGLRLPRGESGLIGVQHTQISRSCCRNPPWYHHFELADGWTADGALLGHPLGGHGREWRVMAAGTLRDGALLYEVSGAHRTRGAENLLAPVRLGRALALAAGLDGQLPSSFAAELMLHYERGPGWRELRGAIGVRRRL
jgi:hypothetical protein